MYYGSRHTYHRYSNEADKANKDICDDFKKVIGLHGLYKQYISVVRVKEHSPADGKDIDSAYGTQSNVDL